MRGKILTALTCSLLFSCGTALNLDRDPSSAAAPSYSVVPGMVLYFDAAFVNGSYGVPSSPCGATTWTDLSGNNNHGTLAAFTCTSTSGFAGTGSTSSPYRLEFDRGSIEKIATNLDVQPSAMASTTWEGWVRPNGPNATYRQTIFSSDDGGFDRQLLIEPGVNTLSAFTGSGPFNAVSADFGQWQHVAVIYTPTSIAVYKNGTKYPGPAPTGLNTSNKLTLGANPAYSAEGFSGGIAYLTVYNRALSDAEISQRCLALASRFPGVVCH